MRIWKIRPRVLVLGVVLTFTALLVASPYSAKAAATNLLSGQKQYYTVMMRADKQSLVYAKVTFENSSATDDLKSFSFTLPDDVAVSNLTVQQILARKASNTCKTYETYDTYKNRVSSLYQTEYYYGQNRHCLQYDESTYDEDFDFDTNMSSTTEYYDYSYYLNRSSDSKFEYKDLTPKQAGQTYTVELPTVIHPKKQGAILVAYTSKSYISSSLGRYHYDFRTFTAKELVSKAVVAINFDDEIYSTLTSSKRQVSTAASSELSTGANAIDSTGYQSKTVDDVQTGIGQGGRYVKEKSQLLPGETFSVKGIFATNKFMLYLPTVAWTIVVLLLIAAGVWFGCRFYRRKHPKTARHDSVQPVQTAPTHEKEVLKDALTVKTALFVSLFAIGASGVLLLVVTGLAAVLNFDSYNSTFITFVVLVSILLALVVLFVLPFVYVLKQHGLQGVYRWLICHVAVLLIVLIAASCVYALVSQPSDYSTINMLNSTSTTQ